MADGGNFANGAVTGAFSYLFSQGAESARKQSREVAVPDGIKRAVEATFEANFGGSINVDQVKLIENSRWANFLDGVTGFFTGGQYGIVATTQPDRIYLSSRITSAQFFGAPELILHEYYHVIMQWNTGSMNNVNYLMNSSRWEQPAIRFGQDNAGLYQSYQGGP